MSSNPGTEVKHRYLRSTGVATEIYNQVVDILSTQCQALQGRFIEYQFVNSSLYKTGEGENMCQVKFGKASSNATAPASQYSDLVALYRVGDGENMCPRDYLSTVDTKSWGICSCWENGARRSKNGTSPKCMNVLPIYKDAVCETGSPYCSITDEQSCLNIDEPHKNEYLWAHFPAGLKASSPSFYPTQTSGAGKWCTQTLISKDNQVCPIPATDSTTELLLMSKLIATSGVNEGKCPTGRSQGQTLVNDSIPKGI